MRRPRTCSMRRPVGPCTTPNDRRLDAPVRPTDRRARLIDAVGRGPGAASPVPCAPGPGSGAAERLRPGSGVTGPAPARVCVFVFRFMTSTEAGVGEQSFGTGSPWWDRRQRHPVGLTVGASPTSNRRGSGPGRRPGTRPNVAHDTVRSQEVNVSRLARGRLGWLAEVAVGPHPPAVAVISDQPASTAPEFASVEMP